MKWPWVSRTELERAERELQTVQLDLSRERETVNTLAKAAMESDLEQAARIKELLEQVAAGTAERRLLIDRIVQLSGQPALYEKPVVQVSTEQPTQDLPAVPRRVSFDDVHAAARKAMADGSFALKGKVH